jgi:hypothetical protein
MMDWFSKQKVKIEEPPFVEPIELDFTVHAENFNSKLVQETKNYCFCVILVKVYFICLFSIKFQNNAKNFNNKFVEETKTIAFVQFSSKYYVICFILI